MHITVCKRCHRVLAISDSDHGKGPEVDRLRVNRIGLRARMNKDGNFPRFDPVKLIPERYKFHMAWCPENKSHLEDIYDDNREQVLRYEVRR